MRLLPVTAQDFLKLCELSMRQGEAIRTLGFSPDSCRECFYRSGSTEYWMPMAYGSVSRMERFLAHCGHRLSPERREAADKALAILQLRHSSV